MEKSDDVFDSDLEKNFDLALLANFVHQVVNPLNGVAGTIDNIVDGTIKDDARKTQRMTAVRSQLEQCISLVRNLAFLAQGFDRLVDSERRNVILPEQLIRSAMFFQEDAEMKGIKITVHDRWIQNSVSAHLELIIQVFMNIFDNCVKYSRSPSSVDINHWIQKKTGHAIITIKNTLSTPLTGVDLEKMFDLGFRGTNAKAVIASGTGLGMYICKKIVEDVHGGSISVQTVGAYSLEFTIRLPHGEEGRDDRKRRR